MKKLGIFLLLAGFFLFFSINSASATTIWANGVNQDSGWFDAEKDSVTGDDDLLCWAATAANVLMWGGWDAGYTNEDAIFDFFVDEDPVDAGGWMENAWNFWFDGSETGGHFNGSSHTGYYTTAQYTANYQEEMDGVGRRGADILFWEDVVEGEELKELAAGPLNIQDLCAFSPIYTNQSFGLNWYASLKRDEATKKGGRPLMPHNTEPETGAPVVRNPHIERHTNYGEAIAYGSQTEAVLVKLATNWMGDDGFLTKLDCQMRRLWLYGQILWLNGKVVRKYIENGEPLVDLELRAENQDGFLVMPAAATVRLLSREHRTEASEVY